MTVWQSHYQCIEAPDVSHVFALFSPGQRCNVRSVLSIAIHCKVLASLAMCFIMVSNVMACQHGHQSASLLDWRTCRALEVCLMTPHFGHIVGPDRPRVGDCCFHKHSWSELMWLRLTVGCISATYVADWRTQGPNVPELRTLCVGSASDQSSNIVPVWLHWYWGGMPCLLS